MSDSKSNKSQGQTESSSEDDSKSNKSQGRTDSNSEDDSKSNKSQGEPVAVKVMALAGNIDPFIPGSNFESYEDRMEQYFVANDVKDEKKTSMFITLSGEAMYDILKSLTHPVKPSTKSYAEIIALLRNHFTPKCNKRAERYKFHKIIQESGEKISEFIVRLKTLLYLKHVNSVIS